MGKEKMTAKQAINKMKIALIEEEGSMSVIMAVESQHLK